ncbi:TRAP transporter small permease [Hoeflea sp. WL0058]|uniref:TRAP transporter small permease protein n=1 Tax=Flavimaribacter sediminis TaxID=2865987 RepID=A0AAE3D109_9HYPH|nr:TRAP transporter small permease [Flavimaribacter sediminis]MBW8637356.1 TRAP transporter small permease [Flavimaribacter sediminis]
MSDADLDLVDEDPDAGTRSRLDRLVARSATVLSWAIFVAFAISVYEVIARYVFDSPTLWVHESTTFLIAATFLIGGPIALARDKHIRVRMIYDAVSPAVRRWLDIVNSVIAMIFFAGLGYAGWVLAWKATHTPSGDIRFEGTGTAWNPPTPALLKIIILICVVLMLFQSAIHLVKAIRRDVSQDTDGDR